MKWIKSDTFLKIQMLITHSLNRSKIRLNMLKLTIFTMENEIPRLVLVLTLLFYSFS